VYILRGEHDGIATLDDILAFYKALPNGDKHFSIMAHSAHIAPLGVNRARFYHLLTWFLGLPSAGVNPTLADIAAAIRSGRTDCKELVRETFARIGDTSGEGARCFIRLFPEQARAAADAMDLIRASGVPIGPLAGIPIPVKDLFDVAGSVTYRGLASAAGRAAGDARCAGRGALARSGAIIVGTTNMTEFAMGGVGINPHFGTPLNPL
jgi:Asp-tRNA(Asn)/Glu-tRNA(Gln) amidotransferase A subunit family amidase